MRPSLVILILLALVLIVLAAVTAKAYAETMPPLTEPGAEAPQLIMPAKLDTEYGAWARGWQRLDLRMRRQLVRHTDALGLPRPRAVPRACDYGSWWEYGVACRRQARYWRDSRIPRLHRRIVRPGGHGVTRWAPLLRYCGVPERELARALRTMRRESGGNPGARNRASGAAGLYQFLPAWWSRRWNPYDPYLSVRHFVRATRHPGGWRHWAATAW